MNSPCSKVGPGKRFEKVYNDRQGPAGRSTPEHPTARTPHDKVGLPGPGGRFRLPVFDEMTLSLEQSRVGKALDH